MLVQSRPLPQLQRSSAVPLWATLATGCAILLATLLTEFLHFRVSFADIAAYVDLSEAIRLQQWKALLNPYWFPLYPLVLAGFRALFGFRLQFDLTALALANSVLHLGLIGAAIYFAEAVRQWLMGRGVAELSLLPQRVLWLAVSGVSCFFAELDLNSSTPDALLSVWLLLMVAFTLRGITRADYRSFLVAGCCGGLAFLTKSFALSAFLLWWVLVTLAVLRSHRDRARLLVLLAGFLLFAAPWIALLSHAEGHFTAGDSGSLNLAWYVNGADRFNPVPDAHLYHSGSASAHFLHPGRVIASVPEIVDFGSATSWGSVPEWDQPAWWSAGLRPVFHPAETLSRLRESLGTLLSFLFMRAQAGVLLLLVILAGYRPGREMRSLWFVALFALGCMAAYALVLLESRYIAFCALLLLIALFALARQRQVADKEKFVEWAVLLSVLLLLLGGVQNTLRATKAEDASELPTQKQFLQSAARYTAIYPQPGESACLGDAMCWDHPLWAHFARTSFTVEMATGNGVAVRAASEGCKQLNEHSALLQRLRARGLQSVVGIFAAAPPCTASWKPLGEGSGVWYLPLQ